MSSKTVTLTHPTPEKLSGTYKRALKNSVHEYQEGAVVKLGRGDSPLLSQQSFEWFPNRQGMTQAIVARIMGELQTFDDKTLFLDIETDSSDEMWNQPLYEFFRLGQYAWGEGEITVTSDLSDVLDQIAKAETVIAHNGHNFDFSVLLGDRALPLTMEDKLFDTWTHATLVCPAPFRYTSRKGHTYVNAASPKRARTWFSLDNLAFQFGLEGKIEDDGLKALAKEFDGFGKIPVDDPRYRAYARQDIVVLRELARHLLEIPYDPDYVIRAQKGAAIDAQMTRNGVLIDLHKTQARSDQQAKEAQDTLDWLVREYGFPTEGKQPWKSNAGKAAIDRMMESGGANIDAWAKTPKGARSYSGDALKAITVGTPLEATGERLAHVLGARTLADQLIRDTHSDGRIHPSIDALQVSSRRSTTRPGVTTFGTRAETIEKSFFVADKGMVMVEADLSNSDQRAVAFSSMDKEYAKRFIPGADGHAISGRLMYGDKFYNENMPEGWEDDPHLAKENPLRHVAKALSHSYSFGASVKKLASLSGLPIETAQRFVDAMERAYPQMIAWQNAVRREGESGWVTNQWGRKMPCDPDRTYTMAPALIGQSSTSEMLTDTFLNLYERAPEVLKWVCFTIHDAFLVQVPEDKVDYYTTIILDCAKQTINGIDIFMEHGQPGRDWRSAQH